MLLVQYSTEEAGNGFPTLASLGQFFYLLFVFIIIILLAYYATKMLGKMKQTNVKGGNMSLVETMSVNMQSSIQLIKVGDQYFLISVSKDRVTFLTEVNKDSISDCEATPIAENSFENMLTKQIGRLVNRKREKSSDQDNNVEGD